MPGDPPSRSHADLAPCDALVRSPPPPSHVSFPLDLAFSPCSTAMRLPSSLGRVILDSSVFLCRAGLSGLTAVLARDKFLWVWCPEGLIPG